MRSEISNQSVFSWPKALRLLTFLVFALLWVQPVWAASLNGASSSRDVFILGDTELRSYDGAGFNGLAPFENSGGGTLDLLQLSSFNGGQGGSTLEFFVLSEVGAFASGPNQNEIGVLDSNGNFINAIPGGADVGTKGALSQGENEEFTIALKSPESTFSTIDADNADKSTHILAIEVKEARSVSIPNANLLGASFAFDLQIGDVVLFIEDMLASGNQSPLVPNLGDFDYNDMVVVARQTANVPEPTSALLLLMGASALGMRRKQRA